MGLRSSALPALSSTNLRDYFQLPGHYAIELEDIEARVSVLEQPTQEANGGRGR